MVETYVRLLLVAPQNLFRQHHNGMMHRFQSGMAKPGVSLLLLELLNFRLVPLYRFHNKQKNLIIDITKILITAKVKRGEHRLFRLAENLGMNLILNLREVMLIKKELKVSVQLEQPSIGSGLMELTTLFVFCGTLPCSYPAKQTCESCLT
jgi:mediator of RNA polymerase II transcription subunit 23